MGTVLSNDVTRSQNERILLYLRQGNRLTGLEALDLFGCSRLSSRICDLKKRGHEILSEFITVLNRFGQEVRVKIYWLDGAEA